MARPKKTKAEIDAAAERAIAEIVEAVQSKTGQALVKIARKQLRWLEVTATGRPKPTMMNAYTAIEALGLEAKFDMFHGRYTINGTSLQGFVGELSDKVTRKVRQLSLMHFGLDPGR